MNTVKRWKFLRKKGRKIVSESGNCQWKIGGDMKTNPTQNPVLPEEQKLNADIETRVKYWHRENLSTLHEEKKYEALLFQEQILIESLQGVMKQAITTARAEEREKVCNDFLKIIERLARENDMVLSEEVNRLFKNEEQTLARQIKECDGLIQKAMGDYADGIPLIEIVVKKACHLELQKDFTAIREWARNNSVKTMIYTDDLLDLLKSLEGEQKE